MNRKMKKKTNDFYLKRKYSITANFVVNKNNNVNKNQKMFHRVTKEVDAGSREAKSFLKNEEKLLEDEKEPSVSFQPQPPHPLSSGSRYNPYSLAICCSAPSQR